MVERRTHKGRRIMREFTLSELSAVDRPAQVHAKVTIMKRDDTVDKKYGSVSELPASVKDNLPATAQRQFMAVANSALEGGSDEESAFKQAWGALKNAGWHKNDDGNWVKKSDDVEIGEAVAKRWLDPGDGARPFSDFLECNLDSKRAHEVREAVGSYIDALDTTLYSIAFDSSVPADRKMLDMRESVESFMNSIRDKWPDVAADVAKAMKSGDDDMPEQLKKQVDDLTKTVKDLTKRLEAATADDTAKKAADLQGHLDDATAKVNDLTEKLEAAEAAKTEAAAKAAMTDAEKTAMAGMDDKAKKEFVAMTPDQRQARMKKSADADPVVYKSDRTGEEFRKSDDPRLVKMAEQADRDAAEVAKSREEAETARLEKQAAESPIAKFAGEKDEKVEVLRAVNKMADEPRKALLKMLEAGGKAIEAAFEKIGHSREDIAKTGQAFETKVTEIQKRDGATRSVAMSKARQEDPEAFKAYQDATQAAN